MTSIMLAVVVLACADWMACSRWTYWRTPIASRVSAQQYPQSLQPYGRSMRMLP
jgi:hypothetical protein